MERVALVTGAAGGLGQAVAARARLPDPFCARQIGLLIGDRQGGPFKLDLRAFLAHLPVDGQPTILVTHQVVVNAFTEITPPAGGGSIFQFNGTGTPRWLGAVPVEARVDP